LLPQDPVVLIVGDRRMVPTRLGALCKRTTLRPFQAAHGGNRFDGVRSSSVWLDTHRRPASLASFSTAGSLFFGVYAFLCLCYYLVFLRS